MLLLIVDVCANVHVLLLDWCQLLSGVLTMRRRHFGGHKPCCAQGFASVRSSPGDHGLAGAQTCLVELRGGDGKQFKLNLITEESFDSINYQASFTAPTGARDASWHTQRVELKEFRPTFRGREVPGAPVLDPAKIRQVGLMISARQAGSFALDVRSISLV
jgi:NADH dehydrogenase [ubiquinone] 1 alpha subcomplex assembly factor 1